MKKTLFSKTAAWLTGGLLLVGAPAIAAAQQFDQPQPGYSQGSSGSWNQPEAQQPGPHACVPQGPQGYGQLGAQRLVHGRVIGLMSLPVPSSNERAVIAVIQTRQQGWQIVELGSEADLSQLELQLGDRLTVQGHEEQLGNKSVLIGQFARSGNQRVAIQRTWSPQMLHQQMRQLRQHFRGGMAMQGMGCMQGMQGMQGTQGPG